MRAGGILPPPKGGEEARPRPVSGGPSDAVPLTEAQEQLWILTQLGDESSRAYNESMTSTCAEISTSRRCAALWRPSWRARGAAHHLLSRRLYQRFAPPGPVDLPLVELPAGGDRQRGSRPGSRRRRARSSPTSKRDRSTAPAAQVEEGWHLLVSPSTTW